MSTTLKTRIKLKYDTLSNWEGSALLLRQGEVAIAELTNGNVEMRVGHGKEGCTWNDARPLNPSEVDFKGSYIELDASEYDLSPLNESKDVDGLETFFTAIRNAYKDGLRVVIKDGFWSFEMSGLYMDRNEYEDHTTDAIGVSFVASSINPETKENVFENIVVYSNDGTSGTLSYNRSGSGQTYTGGNGIEIEGNVISVKEDIHTLTSNTGIAKIFNELDGGGAKYEAKDGTASFAGVNQDTNGGIGAQLYDIVVNTGKGSKLDVTLEGIYYTKGGASALPAAQRHVNENEIATIKDIQKSIAGVASINGVTGVLTTESIIAITVNEDESEKKIEIQTDESLTKENDKLGVSENIIWDCGGANRN